MKAQVSLKTGKDTEAIAKALNIEAKEGLPKVDVKVHSAGEKLKIAARRVARFSPGAELKKAVNRGK